MLHAISFASMALTDAWGKAASGNTSVRRQRAEIDGLRTELALLQEELSIKEAPWSRVPARRRPYYSTTQWMQILQLKAARSWSATQVAQRFVVTEETIRSWLRRLDEGGEQGLVRLGEPVNKFPDFVAHLVRHLKMTCPALGKVEIAQMLARAGLHLGVTTVGRMLKRIPTKDDAVAEEVERAAGRVVSAKRPNHVWHVDLTVVPTSSGFWVPWLPHTKPQRWPFCWWVAIVVDHATRLVVGFALFKDQPTSAQVCAFLDRAIKGARATPKYIISDKGKQFFCEAFKSWCRSHTIQPRFGTVGEHGSIAIIERFIRSMKSECTRKIIVPFRMDAMRHEVACFASWYNEYRPHTGLRGRTPLEGYRDLPPANEAPRLEPRERWPRMSRCASPAARSKCKRGTRACLVVSLFDGRSHLPVVGLRRVA